MNSSDYGEGNEWNCFKIGLLWVFSFKYKKFGNLLL